MSFPNCLTFLVDSLNLKADTYVSLLNVSLLLNPFVLAQSFQTLFPSFVPLYISLSILLFANLVDMTFKLLVKYVVYREVGEEKQK